MKSIPHVKKTSSNDFHSHRRRGAAAVEMAMVAPLLFLLIFGIFDFGSLFFIRETMVNAAREGARELAIQGATLDEAIAITQDRLNGAGVNGATVTGQNAFKGSGDTALARQVFIQVELPTNDALPTGAYLKLFPSNSNMTVKVTMRKEGELLSLPAN